MVLAIGLSTAQTAELSAYYNSVNREPLKPGIDDVTTYSLNGVTLPLNDSTRWTDIVLVSKRSGSIKTVDATFDVLYVAGISCTMSIRRNICWNFSANLTIALRRHCIIYSWIPKVFHSPVIIRTVHCV